MTTSCRNFPLQNGTVLWARVSSLGLIEASSHNDLGAAYERHAQIRCSLVMQPFSLMLRDRPPETIGFLRDLSVLPGDDLAASRASPKVQCQRVGNSQTKNSATTGSMYRVRLSRAPVSVSPCISPRPCALCSSIALLELPSTSSAYFQEGARHQVRSARRSQASYEGAPQA